MTQRAVLTLEFSVEHSEREPQPSDGPRPGYIAEARANRAELLVELNRAVAERDYPWRVAIEDVDIREGSIVVEIWAVLSGIGGALGYYGNIRQGLNELTHDLRSVCRWFLARFLPGHPVLRTSAWVVNPAGTVVSLPTPKARRDLQTYLIVSHAVLLATLIGIATVLLIRTG